MLTPQRSQYWPGSRLMQHLSWKVGLAQIGIVCPGDVKENTIQPATPTYYLRHRYFCSMIQCWCPCDHCRCFRSVQGSAWELQYYWSAVKQPFYAFYLQSVSSCHVSVGMWCQLFYGVGDSYSCVWILQSHADHTNAECCFDLVVFLWLLRSWIICVSLQGLHTWLSSINFIIYWISVIYVRHVYLTQWFSTQFFEELIFSSEILLKGS